ncbi:helix-turn-helix domain-containing protein [Paenibacillus sp. TAB 01]|uniref:helix-turn-helix domain-containing protein n=1 Tax=Paenibacillus sp. TAB 01 TaxID=3368988 RepID=UPI00375305BA
MDFSESVKKILKSRDLSPSDLARLTGYTPQYIHNLLDGKRRWNETTINRTCGALGLEIKIETV